MNWDLQTISEWRLLGYYYEYNEDLKQWRLFGSKKGLTCFVDQLNSYVSNTENNSISEHKHFGPHNYLKILTWHKAEITEKYIGGTFVDLQFLKELVAEKLKTFNVGEVFQIGHEYSQYGFAILFFIMADDFDTSFVEFGKQ